MSYARFADNGAAITVTGWEIQERRPVRQENKKKLCSETSFLWIAEICFSILIQIRAVAERELVVQIAAPNKEREKLLSERKGRAPACLGQESDNYPEKQTISGAMSMLKVIVGLCIVLHSSSIGGTAGTQSTAYAELQRLNATCKPDDTCSPFPQENLDNLLHRNCECGSHCTLHKTCCVDSPYKRSYREIKGSRSKNYQCFNVHGTGESYFMVTMCPSRWFGGSDVKNLCEEDVRDWRDPFILAPATHSGITYKNFFCALCHGADSGEIRLWEVSVTKIVSGPVDDNFKETLVEELHFDDGTGKWGLTEIVDGSMNFDPVDIGFVPNEKTVRPCIPDLISDCASEWKDETVREKCLSYMAAIYVPPKGSSLNGYPEMLRYRNIHCAVCNFAYQSASVCTLRGLFPPPLDAPPLSFTLLLDVNPSDGNTVGKVNQCKKGEAYDPFFKKCRALLCALPGYRMEGDRCVRD